VRYAVGVQKIIREILVLLWKAFRLVLWKWLKPILGRIFFFTVLFTGLIALLIFIATR
jgi:hypothetical protein